MSSSRQFDEADRDAAHAFVAAARAAGVRRVVYLGGLGHGRSLSEHLRSRQEVGEILRGSGIPTIELRASIVIGSGRGRRGPRLTPHIRHEARTDP